MTSKSCIERMVCCPRTNRYGYIVYIAELLNSNGLHYQDFQTLTGAALNIYMRVNEPKLYYASSCICSPMELGLKVQYGGE
jgi:hypothetical protein